MLLDSDASLRALKELAKTVNEGINTNDEGRKMSVDEVAYG